MPFIETYLVGSDPENINHFGAVRFRLQGAGLFRMTLYDLDKIRNSTLTPLTMSETANIEPTRLSNFVTQRSILRCETTAINDFMKVNRIIFFVKPIYTSYPGTS